LVAQGLTGTEIGAIMQRSRNAVLGEAFRRGISLNKHPKAAKVTVVGSLAGRRLGVTTSIEREES
jgi:hypothetical protein